jgi:hypothetical protein
MFGIACALLAGSCGLMWLVERINSQPASRRGLPQDAISVTVLYFDQNVGSKTLAIGASVFALAGLGLLLWCIQRIAVVAINE